MGFLERLRASKATTIEKWKSLEDISQLDDIDIFSKARPVVIFKHSTTCGISAGAKYRLESGWDDVSEDGDFYYLDLLRYRPISNLIAQRYGVRHESPQILIIRNGVAVYHTSHNRIHSADLSNQLRKYT